MSAPTCYVIDAADWGHFMTSLGGAFALCFLLTWVMSVNWFAWGEFLRRQLRRRRLRRIRQSRAA